MISFSNIHKQYGRQLIFVDASFQFNPGEKVDESRAGARPAQPVCERERAIRETNQQAAFAWQQSMLASVRHCQ